MAADQNNPFGAGHPLGEGPFGDLVSTSTNAPVDLAVTVGPWGKCVGLVTAGRGVTVTLSSSDDAGVML